ncbi:hypothetical protein LJC28_02155, partial [Dysgonomonas sp. OttesenSCG-928-D17]|nr:hypothetical protein [Dysgonomonas sp. OttesenSCG-928-D17]
LEEITRKISQKTVVVDLLADILHIEKGAVHKRMKGEIPFTFSEAMTISRYLGISLDNMEMISQEESHSFKLKLIEYINPAESDFSLLEEMTAILKTFTNVPNPEAGEITNILPQPLYVNREHISKFYLFKWKYSSQKKQGGIRYNDIVISNKLKKARKEYVKWARLLHADYIFDRLLFHYLVTDIKYFYQVGRITKEDVLLIKQDVVDILDEIDELTNTGKFNETGKEVNIYISNVNVDTNYIYISTPHYQLTIIKAFLLNGVASTDKTTVEEVKRWIQTKKQQSTLITKCNERDRVNFLKEQYNIVESLAQL